MLFHSHHSATIWPRPPTCRAWTRGRQLYPEPAPVIHSSIAEGLCSNYSITLQHNTLHFFYLYRPPPNRRNNLADSMFTEQLPDLLNYGNNLSRFVCLFGDMNIHIDNPLQSLTKQNLTTLSLYVLVKVINKPTSRCSHTIDWAIVRPDDDIHKKSTVTDSIESDHYCTKSYFNVSVSKLSTLHDYF